MQKLSNIHPVELFLDGDARIEGPSCTYQGRVRNISHWRRRVRLTLDPFAEKAPDGMRWILKQRFESDFEMVRGSAEGDTEGERRQVSFKVHTGETITLFKKGHDQTIDYEKLQT